MDLSRAGQLIPIAQASITLTLTGAALLLIVLAIGGYWGFQQGFRNMLTVTLWTIAAYVLTVQGGNFVIGVINRLWQNGPALIAFLLGQDPDAAPQLDPLISPTLQIPLFFRLITFVALVFLGFFFNKTAGWRGNPSPKEPLAQPLGLFAGALVVLLWSNAAVNFWTEYREAGGARLAPLDSFLNTLPDVRAFIPSLITIFFLILIILVIVNFPKVWKP
ncbi:MAG: hypothetical protein RMK84_13340 [Oscillochloridaceae bacterium]|nr:hypothetical protein [Chloroflexaceae bacterium]MDW8391104.1 hypothetical protein [Oscillochloridaceae bacterium]